MKKISNEAQKILTMIEAVSVGDTDTMDEIDGRVWCYLKGYSFNEIVEGTDSEGWEYPEYKTKDILFINEDKDEQEACFWEAFDDYKENPYPALYTRSRDALKAIRPDGEIIIDKEFEVWSCQIDFTPKTHPLLSLWGRLTKKKIPAHAQRACFEAPKLPTEELAELHAVIQAIEWERNNKGRNDG